MITELEYYLNKIHEHGDCVRHSKGLLKFIELRPCLQMKVHSSPKIEWMFDVLTAYCLKFPKVDYYSPKYGGSSHIKKSLKDAKLNKEVTYGTCYNLLNYSLIYSNIDGVLGLNQIGYRYLHSIAVRLNYDNTSKVYVRKPNFHLILPTVEF